MPGTPLFGPSGGHQGAIREAGAEHGAPATARTPSIRLFVAITIPADLQEELNDAAKALPIPGGRTGKSENIHLTLKFLGNTPEELLPEVAAALKRCAGAHPAYDIEPGRFGAFPALKRPRVIWVGLEGGARETTAIQSDIEEAMTGLGFQADNRFHPHITVVRNKFPRPIDFDVSQVDTPWAGRRVRVADIVLFQSKLSSQGPAYTVLARFALS